MEPEHTCGANRKIAVAREVAVYLECKTIRCQQQRPTTVGIRVCIGLIDERRERIARSPLEGRYREMIDRESAFEMLKARAEAQEAEEERASERKTQSRRSPGGRRRQSAGEAMIKSAARSIGSQLGRQIIRGILGSLFGTRR